MLSPAQSSPSQARQGPPSPAQPSPVQPHPAPPSPAQMLSHKLKCCPCPRNLAAKNIERCFKCVAFNVDPVLQREYVHKDIMIKCRDFPAVDGKFLEIFSVFLVLQWMLCEHTTSGYYLDGTIEGQQLSSVWLELDPPNAHSGRLYQTYVASTNLTDYGIRFLVCMECFL